MNAIEVPVRGERLVADLKRLREFGARGTGVARASLSPVDVESRHLEAQWHGSRQARGRQPQAAFRHRELSPRRLS